MDIENEFENMLNNKADGVDVNADLDSILDGTRVIRTSPSMPVSRTSPVLLVTAGIAASLLIGMLGLVLLRSGNETTPAPLVEASETGYFPVLGEVPSSVQVAPHATVLELNPASPTGIVAAVGVQGTEQWTSVSKVMAMTEQPIWFSQATREVTLGGLTTAIINEGDGPSIYSWQQNAVWVTVRTELTDPTQLLLAVRVSRSEQNGQLQLNFNDLPTGFVVLSGPTQMATRDLPAVGVSTDKGFPENTNIYQNVVDITVVVHPTGLAASLGVGALSQIEVKGASGVWGGEIESTGNKHFFVVWQLAEDRTAVLSTSGLTSEETLALARDVTFVNEATWHEIYSLDDKPQLPSTTIPVDIMPTTTEPITTTTTTPEPEQPIEVAWSVTEAERYVSNFLAALAAGAYEQAAYSATDAGIIVDGQTNDELPAEAFEGMCAAGACAGPYSVFGEGPGFIDPEFSNASSMVTVTHLATGAQTQIQVGTFEGQVVIADLPPLVPSSGGATLVESLFGSDIPSRVVVQRFKAFEIWEGGNPEWVTHWYANDVHQIEGEVVAVAGELVNLRNPSLQYDGQCSRLMTRDGEILALSQCNDTAPRLFEVISGSPRPIQDFPEDRVEVESSWVAERGGTLVHGASDAEGNSIVIKNASGVDLLGDDYSSIETLSTDGSLLAYVDHRDPAAYSHFWSGVVVVRDTSTGAELGRWILDNPVVCLEIADGWIIACESAGVPAGEPVEQISLVAINVKTGEINRVQTPVRLFLPS